MTYGTLAKTYLVESPLTHEDAQINSFEILSTFVKQRTYTPTSPYRPSTSEKLGKDEAKPLLWAVTPGLS
jgi:hypothetical protein